MEIRIFFACSRLSNVASYLTQNMQGMLEGFLTHLSTISQEIQSLQEQSASINVQLTNRKQVHTHLSSFIDQLMVPEVMIQ